MTTEHTNLPQFLTSGEVAKLFRVDPSTLSRWRKAGKGPKPTQITAKTVRYRRDEVLKYLEEHDSQD